MTKASGKGYSAHNQRAGVTLAERLAHYSDRSGGPDACWIWTGGRLMFNF